MRRENFTPSKHSVLCSAHFDEKQIDRTSLCCVRLRKGAVPMIFDSFPSHLQSGNKKCRKSPTKRTPGADSVCPPSLAPRESETLSYSTDSPENRDLKRRLENMGGHMQSYSNKLKKHLQSKCHLIKNNASFKKVIIDLKKQNIVPIRLTFL